MTKWEYALFNIDIHMSPVLKMSRWGVEVPGEKKPRNTREGVEDYLCDYGAEGWELVGVSTGSNRDGIISKAVLYFKRPLTAEREAERAAKRKAQAEAAAAKKKKFTG